jgi:hypothetical protein
MNLEMVMPVSRTSSRSPITGKRAARCPFGERYLHSFPPNATNPTHPSPIIKAQGINQQLQKEILGLNAEVARMQNLNEKVSLNKLNTPPQVC